MDDGGSVPDFDALIEGMSSNMDMGADDDEMDMMYAMEQEQNATDKDGGAFDEPAAGTQGATQTQAGADDDDLEWLANAGATQTQGPGTNGAAADALFPDDDEDAATGGPKPPSSPSPSSPLRMKRFSPAPRDLNPPPWTPRPSTASPCPSPPPTGAGCSSDGSPRPWPTTRPRDPMTAALAAATGSRGSQEAVSAFRRCKTCWTISRSESARRP